MQIVVAEDRLAEAKLAWMLPVRTLTQLLRSSWPRILDLVRAGGMYGLGEQAGHWSPKARGVEREARILKQRVQAVPLRRRRV